MRTYAIVNKKGGVGKTTTAKNLAYILAVICKKRVLLIDADPQGNASSIVPYPNEAGLSSLLYYGGAEWYPDLIDQTDIPGLDLMPCGKDLDELDLACMLGRRNALEYLDVLAKLLEVIAGDDEYDVVVIDCPPSLYSLGCLNALRAADKLIIPTDASVYSATGMADLLRQIALIRQNFPPIHLCNWRTNTKFYWIWIKNQQMNLRKLGQICSVARKSTLLLNRTTELIIVGVRAITELRQNKTQL